VGGRPFKELAPLDGEGAGVTVQERGRTTRTEKENDHRLRDRAENRGYDLPGWSECIPCCVKVRSGGE
jgi:hypothetical protein